jgi:DNA-binding response OmpR family regulator
MLVIDDHETARGLIVDHFIERGWIVASAPDFKSALDLAARQQPDVIISEVTLSDTRGAHFVRSLKTVVDHDVRVIAVTNVPVELVATRTFDMVFAKPADLDVLSDFVDAALK